MERKSLYKLFQILSGVAFVILLRLGYLLNDGVNTPFAFSARAACVVLLLVVILFEFIRVCSGTIRCHHCSKSIYVRTDDFAYCPYCGMKLSSSKSKGGDIQ